MRFLRQKDYQKQIQNDNLSQIVEGDYSILLDAENAAQAELTSYLAQRYIISKVFTDTTTFDSGATYYGKNLVEYSADAYSITSAYTVDERVVYGNKIYKNISGATGSIPSATTASTYWSYIVDDKTLYYANTPAAEWSNTTTYSVGDVIWYNDVTYQALASTTGSIPSSLTSSIWSGGGTYSFSGAYPEDTAYWTKGDNRNQQIVMYMIDITLYHLHSRINPRNVPDLRQVRYDGANAFQSGGAIAWLKKVAGGDVTADLPNILPQQGMSIRFGKMDIRDTNSY